jgi:predicted unusual protein kinase regulating ubiquinone biosynthesis (AarF/ABC1/UbiB family)
LEELKKLQDGMPEAPIADVLATLREEFGAAAASISVPEDLPPLGVASIAQVHRATWTPPGATASRDIVIKVQHRDAGRTFRQDMWSSAILARVAHWIDPDSVPDVRPLIARMRDVTARELDFRLEAENLSHAGKAVRDAGADVVVPSVVPGLAARRAMAMEFIDGVPLNKLKDELPSVDPARLVAALVDHYGVQFVVDGRFNADPHPGNLMVERATGKLVVLDWGMCITLPRNHVQAYASILFSVATYDVWGLVKGLEAVEMDFRDGEVFEPLAFLRTMRFILRDSKPMDMARDEMSQAISTIETIHKNGPRRYKRSPLAAFQGDFVYFGKALALLYSVSSTLDVRHPILQTLVLRALSTMLGRAPAEPLPRQPSAFLPALTAALPEARGPLERELQQHLRGLYAQGRLLGAQLCVLQGGQSGQPCSLLADIAIGVHGWTHHAPITASTRFNLTDISKLVVAVAVLRLVDSGRLKLSDRLAERWETFRDGGDEPERAAITVEQVLGHTAGCWCPLPPSVTELHELLDPEAMLEAVARTPCAEAPGTTQRYHHTAFGYLLRGACRHLAGRELADLWTELARDVSAQAGGLARERDLLLRLPPEEAECVAMPARAITSASLEEVSTMISQVYMLMGGSDSSPSAGAKAAQGIWGREHLIDPSLYGRSAGGVAASCLPGLQGFGNARAVASLLQAVSSGGVLSKRLLKESLRSRRPPAPAGDGRPPEDPAAELASELGHVLRLGCFQDFGLGVQLVGPKVWAGADTAVGGLPPAWGHLAQGGSAAVVLPGPQPVAVALLVNMAEGGVGAHAAASSLLQVVARRCGLTQRSGSEVAVHG